MTLLDAVPEALYRESGNPFWVWIAINHAVRTGENIPAWCIAYIKDVAPNVAAVAWNAANGEEPGPPQLSQALGFSQGPSGTGSAFKELRKDFAAMEEAERVALGLIDVGAAPDDTNLSIARKLKIKRHIKKRGQPRIDLVHKAIYQQWVYALARERKRREQGE